MDEDRASCSLSPVILTDLERHASDQLATDSIPTSPQGARWSGTVSAIFWSSQLAVALYISGWPIDNVEKVPGLAWLVEHTPEPYHSDWRVSVTPWYMVASLQIVFACHQLPPLHS